MDLGWDRFLKMVQTELNNLKGGSNMSNDKNMPSNWAKEAWEWATKNSITDGTRPKDNVTREELVTMLYRYHKKVK